MAIEIIGRSSCCIKSTSRVEDVLIRLHERDTLPVAFSCVVGSPEQPFLSLSTFDASSLLAESLEAPCISFVVERA